MMGIVVPETCWAYKNYQHLISNLQQTENETTNVVMNIIIANSWWWT